MYELAILGFHILSKGYKGPIKFTEDEDGSCISIDVVLNMERYPYGPTVYGEFQQTDTYYTARIANDFGPLSEFVTVSFAETVEKILQVVFDLAEESRPFMECCMDKFLYEPSADKG